MTRFLSGEAGLFQSTHPRGVRLNSSSVRRQAIKFQSTHPRGVRPIRLQRSVPSHCFNPRTREGCDKNIREQFAQEKVSIHAPARGATHLLAFLSGIWAFQSTHPRGVRLNSSSVRRQAIKFQSTHPRGVRRSLCAPGRESACFNPRTREGCDLSLSASRRCFRSFNPRTREGCDNLLAVGNQVYLDVSIHAPARGATQALRGNGRLRSFNPRTREGCDCPLSLQHRKSPCFNPRTREGCDPAPANAADPVSAFQSTHPRGVRRQRPISGRASHAVSIHAPARGAT